MKLRTLARKAKAHTLSFRKAHRPIIVLGLRRGGSTMIADAIAVNKGVWLANEPFAILPNHNQFAYKKAQLQALSHSHYYALESPVREQFETYVDNLLNARCRPLGTCRNTKFPLVADRVCLKVLNALWMSDWFGAHTDAHILPVLRHPASQALSVLRQGWGFPVKAYYADRHRLEGAFSDVQLRCMAEVLESEDPWRIAVLDYVVTSKQLRELYADKLHRYEDIVRAPEQFVDDVLVAEYGLQDREQMVATFGRPSGSARMSLSSVNDAISAGDMDVVLKSWMDKLDPAQVTAGQHILDCFEVAKYTFYDPY